MASTIGFEPMTARLEGVCSIQLSYVDINCLNIIANIKETGKKKFIKSEKCIKNQFLLYYKDKACISIYKNENI